jgi:hypothetical protein
MRADSDYPKARGGLPTPLMPPGVCCQVSCFAARARIASGHPVRALRNDPLVELLREGLPLRTICGSKVQLRSCGTAGSTAPTSVSIVLRLVALSAVSGYAAGWIVPLVAQGTVISRPAPTPVRPWSPVRAGRPDRPDDRLQPPGPHPLGEVPRSDSCPKCRDPSHALYDRTPFRQNL